MTSRTKLREWNKRIKKCACARRGQKRTAQMQLHAFVTDMLRKEMAGR